MKEVIYKPWHQQGGYKPTGKACPSCATGSLVHGFIKCPDNLPGCCVAHYGYTCTNCGRVFQ
jgi:hypothetical protein